MTSAYKCTDFERCSCEKERKVPKAEWSFLQDQRSHRKMKIGAVDKILTKQIQKREERKLGLKRSAEEKEPFPSALITKKKHKLVFFLTDKDSNQQYAFLAQIRNTITRIENF